MSNHINYFINNSTKKILDLVKSLPADRGVDKGQLEEVVNSLKNEQKNRLKKRFQKRINGTITDKDLISDTDTSGATAKAPDEEFVVLKVPSGASCSWSESESTDGDADGSCVTIRKEFNEAQYLEQLGHGDRYCKQRKTKSKSNSDSNCAKKKESVDSIEKLVGDHLESIRNKRTRRSKINNNNRKKAPEVENNNLKISMDWKLRNLIEKSSNNLKEIRVVLDAGIPPPDGSEDLMRRKKRTIEFASRFSRNYLYQLNRNILDVENILKTQLNGCHSLRSNSAGGGIMLNHKLFSAFHTASLGLEAFSKHLPGSIVTELPEKFREFLVSVTNVCELFRGISSGGGDDDANDGQSEVGPIEELEFFCNSLLTDEDLFYTAIRPSCSIMSVAHQNSHQGGSQISRRAESKSSRFSMYQSTIPKESGWKKAVANLARKKFNVASKYKTATYKHRPPAPSLHQQQQQQQQQTLAPHATSQTKVKFGQMNRIKVAGGQRDEKVHATFNDMDQNVTTVLQHQESKHRMDSVSTTTADNRNIDNDGSDAKRDSSSTAVVRKNKSKGNLWKYANGFFQKVCNNQDKFQEMSGSDYQSIVNHFVAAVSDGADGNKNDESDGKVLEEAQTILEDKFGKSIEDMDFKEFYTNLLACANQHAADYQNEVPKTTVVSTSGTSNVQLICVKDDSPDAAVEKEPQQPQQQQQETKETVDNNKISSGDNGEKEVLVQTVEAKDCDASVEPAEELLIYKECEDDTTAKGTSDANNKKSNKGKKLIALKLLPKQTMLRIIGYKLQFHREAKKNSMYKRSANVMPWTLVAKISDILLEENLQAITRDIQVDKILKKIYSQEFK